MFLNYSLGVWYSMLNWDLSSLVGEWEKEDTSRQKTS